MSTGTVFDPIALAPISSQKCALAIMTKAPRAGEVKTRLVPPLTPAEAAEINRCFLHDLATSISRACLESPARGVAVYTPVNANASYEGILPLDFFLLPQRGDYFGERLSFAAEDLLNAGFASVCLINSDSPTVPAACFAEAANALAKQGDRIAIGPSDDGGYYLIGMKQIHRRMFEEIDWSTDRVFNQTMKRAAEIAVDVKLLPKSYDVDDAAALRRLCCELLNDNAHDCVAPATRKFLRGIINCEGRARIWPE
jgi:rSAM/selenodomain-associated transferase 1